MKFSIVLLSRNRPEMLCALLESIFKTSYFDNEILVGCDLCGDSYWELHQKFKNRNLSFHYQKRDSNLHSYINKLAKITTGEFIFVLNDDCILTRNNWDLESSYILPKISYGKTHDDSIDKISSSYASFPIITREAYNRLGFLMDEEFGNHGADVILYRIFHSAGCVVDLPMVQISHLYHNTQDALKERQNDLTATQMIQRTFDAGFSIQKLIDYDVVKYAERLLHD